MKDFRLTTEDTASACQSLAYLLEAGLNHGDALLVLARDETQPRLQKKLEAMAAQADAGWALHQTFEQAGCFPAYACRLLKVGEQVGSTAQTLAELARYYRERAAMTRRIRATLTYPAALLGVLLGVVVVLLVWVMPVFQQVYAGLGSSLTGFAGWLLTFGRGLGRALPWIGLGILLALAVLAIPAVRRGIQKAFSDRGVWKDIHSAQYLQALSLGLNCGLPAQEAADLASGLAQQGFAKRCSELGQRLAQGQSMGSALAEGGFLGARDRRLLDAAARSGHGDQALTAIARESLQHSQQKLEGKLAGIEPAMVAVACGMIALVLISVMVPLVGIMNALG